MLDCTNLTLISNMDQTIDDAPNGRSLTHYSKPSSAVYSRIGMAKNAVYDQYFTGLYTFEV